MAAVKRRSIVEFEKWLDKEIAQVETSLVSLNAEATELARQRAEYDVQLATLKSVKVKLAPVSAEDENGFTGIPSPFTEDGQPPTEPNLFDTDAEVVQQ